MLLRTLSHPLRLEKHWPGVCLLMWFIHCRFALRQAAGCYVWCGRELARTFRLCHKNGPMLKKRAVFKLTSLSDPLFHPPVPNLCMWYSCILVWTLFYFPTCRSCFPNEPEPEVGPKNPKRDTLGHRSDLTQFSKWTCGQNKYMFCEKHQPNTKTKIPSFSYQIHKYI